MSFYIVAIGGSGAKCVESIVHLASTGLFTEEPIKVLFIDPDESNGNLAVSKKCIKTYSSCYELTKGSSSCPWLKTEISLIGNSGTWSPIGDDKSLSSIFNYGNLQRSTLLKPLGNLFDVLYTKAEREEQLDEGFRGRPAIGSAVMSQVSMDNSAQEPWSTLVSQIERDLKTGKFPKIFLCGSIFGGTGASGFPTIGRLIANRLEKIEGRDRVKLGGLLMLPYFQFEVPADEKRMCARPEQFLLNTEAALRYYVSQARERFDAVYLLGDQNLAPVGGFSTGKDTQKNVPHFVELYGALAARHFLLTTETLPVVLISRSNPNQITWKDIPDSVEVKSALSTATRFAFTWFADFQVEFDAVRKGGGQLPPFLTRFFRPKGIFANKQLPDFGESENQRKVRVINDWCESYLSWLANIHFSVSNVNLFRVGNFAERAANQEIALKKDVEKFSTLVFEQRMKEQDQQDTIQNLKNKLFPIDAKSNDSLGMIGLAKSAYLGCKL